MLHDNGRVTVFDNRRTDNLEILVLEDDLLIVLFLPQRERRGLDRGLVPSNGSKKEKKIHAMIIGLTLELF